MKNLLNKIGFVFLGMAIGFLWVTAFSVGMVMIIGSGNIIAILGGASIVSFMVFVLVQLIGNFT